MKSAATWPVEYEIANLDIDTHYKFDMPNQGEFNSNKALEQ